MITVIVPCFNSEATIQRAIKSIIEQSIFHLVDEILIIDDASADRTLEMIKKVSNKKIKVISLRDNSGSAAIPRNVGIDNNKSNLIAFLDSDDFWYANHLESSIEILGKNVLLTCTNAKTQNNKLLLPRLFNRYITTFELLVRNSIIMSSVVCRAEIFNNKNFYFTDSSDKKLYNDYLLWLKISTNNKIRYLNKVTMFYNITFNSDSSKYAHPLIAEKNTILNFLKWTKQNSYFQYFIYMIYYQLIYFLKKSIVYLSSQLKLI